MKRYQINILHTTVLLATFFLVTFRAPAQHKGGNKGSARDDIQTVTSIVNEKPAERWEEYFISGNGTMGVMVAGDPYNETVVINHEKLYVPLVNVKREATYTAKGWEQARKMAKDGQYAKAYDYMIGYYEGATSMMWDSVNFSPPGRLPREDVHPGLHLNFTLNNEAPPQQYEREMVLNTGEVVVRWEDKHGKWERKTFVSRPHNLIVISMKAPEGVMFSGSVRFLDAPGRKPNALGSITIEHHDNEMYFHGAYNYTNGKPQPEGYHCLARVVCTGGSTKADSNQRIVIKDANEVLILARISYLDPAGEPDAASLRLDLADIPADYKKLLQQHAKIHGEMFSRVKLDLGSGQGSRVMGKQLVDKSVNEGITAELLEAVHAIGRYTLISSSGELPPPLMGIWSYDWDAPWGGRYTFDSNLNLAISAGSQGNMHEAMESYFGFIEDISKDWEENAMRKYGFRGYESSLTQGYRDGVDIRSNYPWTGGAGWLSSYFYDHYLYTGDKMFLKNRVVPLLKEIAIFYEDFLEGMEDENGRYMFYPSISPENSPLRAPDGSRTGVLPNATSEICICKQVFTNLISACEELGIEQNSVQRWKALLSKMPEYRINDDGAIAEWSFPGVVDNYNYHVNAHLYCLYPSHEVTPYKTPDLSRAARIAIQKRLDIGRGGKATHGLMHMMFFAARLKDADLIWELFDIFARSRYMYSNMMTSHYPEENIFNLDGTLSLPAVLMEMLIYSEPGMLQLLPALPAEQLPKGRIDGALARGAITVERLEWDMSKEEINATLQSKEAQTVELLGPGLIKSVKVEKGQGKIITQSKSSKAWQLSLPSGETVEIKVKLAK